MIDYFRMMRIGDWIKFYTLFPLAGALLAGGDPARLALILVVYFNLIGYAFVVNNYFDVEIDGQNSRKLIGKKNPLVSGTVTKRGVLLLMLVQIGAALVISSRLSYMGTVSATANLLLLTVYSATPFRLKERYLWDVVNHGLMFGALPFLTGFLLCQGSPSSGIMLISLLSFILGCEALIAHQIVDYPEDLNNTTTTVTRIGERRGLWMLGGLAVLSLPLLLKIAQVYQIPLLVVVSSAVYLMAYPAYSVRGVFHDIGDRASAERGSPHRRNLEVAHQSIPGQREL